MRLKSILIACFIAVALVPVLTLGLWPLSRPIENEIQHVAEKHLLVARHIRESLVRYQRDLKTAVSLVIAQYESATDDRQTKIAARRALAHLSNLYIRRVCLLTPLRGAVAPKVRAVAGNCSGPAARQAAAVGKELGSSENFRFSSVIRGIDGKPVMYLARRHGDHIEVAAFSTDLIRTMQKNVFFGEGGHAAIVDKKGNVLAHPKPNWVQARKNTSKVSAVSAMMKGKTGVTQFWSPAAKKTMIAGYTAVPGAGWGVMVPQPFSELEAKAAAVRDQITLAALIGILIAIIVGLLISRQMVRPVHAVGQAVRKVTGGDSSARVLRQSRWIPKEMRNLSAGFNAMASTIEKSKINLEKQVERRTDALTHSQTKLTEALEQAQAASKTKSAFLAQMSHELRTPLNAILGYSEMMEREILGPVGIPQYRDYLSHIHDSGTLLRDLIGDILDATKLEDGSMVLNEHGVDVSDILERAVVQAAPMALEYEVTVLRLFKDKLATIYADETRILQIVTNLLTNAVKFTKSGGYVMVAAGFRKDGSFTISIRDNGIGMSADDVKRIAEPFHQAMQNRLHPAEGTGLGVTISTALARLHGGDLIYRSAPGVGTIAEFRLPASRIVEAPGRKRKGPAPASIKSGADRGRFPVKI